MLPVRRPSRIRNIVHINLDDDPALHAALRSVAALLGATQEEVARQAIREGLPAVELRRTLSTPDLRQRRDLLKDQLAAVEGLLRWRDEEDRMKQRG